MSGKVLAVPTTSGGAPETTPWATNGGGTQLAPSTGQIETGHEPEGTGAPADYRNENYFRAMAHAWFERMQGATLFAESAYGEITIGGAVTVGDKRLIEIVDEVLGAASIEFETSAFETSNTTIALHISQAINGNANLKKRCFAEAAGAVVKVRSVWPGRTMAINVSVTAGTGTITLSTTPVTPKLRLPDEVPAGRRLSFDVGGIELGGSIDPGSLADTTPALAIGEQAVVTNPGERATSFYAQSAGKNQAGAITLLGDVPVSAFDITLQPLGAYSAIAMPSFLMPIKRGYHMKLRAVARYQSGGATHANQGKNTVWEATFAANRNAAGVVTLHNATCLKNGALSSVAPGTALDPLWESTAGLHTLRLAVSLDGTGLSVYAATDAVLAEDATEQARFTVELEYVAVGGLSY